MQQRLKAKLMVARWGARQCLGQAGDEQRAMEMRPKAPWWQGQKARRQRGSRQAPPFKAWGGQHESGKVWRKAAA